MSSRPELKLDWCSHEAAMYAVMKWHYSSAMPAGKLAKLGVWEDGKFVGVVLFGRGATPHLCKPYRLTQYECVELIRIAMTDHKTTVSRIVSIALRILSKQSPRLRLVVSFADPSQKHHGGVYQAGNWLCTGSSAGAKFFVIHGKLTHPRSLGSKGLPQNLAGARRIDRHAREVYMPGKYRYLMPLDADMRRQIEPLRKPYPKRAGSVDSGTPGDQPGRGGAIPTSALSIRQE